MGEAVLFAEAKMGKLLKDIPRQQGVSGGRGKKKLRTNDGTKFTGLQKTGIGRNDIVRAQTLADNEDAIEEVFEEEISKGYLPTIEKVLSKVREKTAERDREALKRKAKTYSKMKKY